MLKKLFVSSFLVLFVSCSSVIEKKEDISLILLEREDDVFVEIINTSSMPQGILPAFGFWEQCSILYADVKFEPAQKTDGVSEKGVFCNAGVMPDIGSNIKILLPNEKLTWSFRKYDIFEKHNREKGIYFVRAVYDFTRSNVLSNLGLQHIDGDEVFIGKVYSDYMKLHLN
ncbi:hypothetical protein [Curvivirga sp.]|uniref:hypothetical protein n=1 Tax=Curvivirga sp. TaxID=2856848 RepID=UPI003B59D093